MPSSSTVSDVRASGVLAATVATVILLSPGGATRALAGPCDPPVTNPIACENSKPGASDWELSASMDRSILGFTTDISVEPGRDRLLQGQDRRDGLPPRHLPHGLLRRDGRPQDRDDPALGCAAADAAGLPDRRRHRPGRLRQLGGVGLVGRPGRRGLRHLLRQARSRGHRRSEPRLLRRPRRRRSSDLLFQTSDTTWQAYNDYGGNSLYVGLARRARLQGQLQPALHHARRARRTRQTGSSTPSTRWCAGWRRTATTSATPPVSTATAAGGEMLEHKVFLSVGHDEYWSAAQRANVEAARDAGRPSRLLQRQRGLLEDPLGEQHRRLEHAVPDAGLLQGDARQRQDRPAARSLDRDLARPALQPARRRRTPENALTGTIFMVNGRTDAITGLRAPTASCGSGGTRASPTLAPGQTATPPDRDAGLRVGRGSRQRIPACRGSFGMSTRRLSACADKLLDYGSTTDADATHSLTLYRHASGALVFGAGTIQWSWGLDGHHDRGASAR